MSDASTNELLKTLESKYVEGHYSDVEQLLLKAKDHFPKGQFHYNFGTLLAKQNKIGASRYHLEKAYQLGEYHSALINNLNFITKEVNSQEVISWPIQFFSDLHFDFYLMFVLFCSAFLMVFKKFRMIKSAKVFLITLFSLNCLTWGTYYYFSTLETAIVLQKGVLKEGPSKIYNDLGEIKEGEKIYLGKFSNGWYLIKYPKSRAGWVNKSDIAVL